MPLQKSLGNPLPGQAEPIASHRRARALFDRTVDDYQRRADMEVQSFSSLVFQRRIDIVTHFLSQIQAPGRVLDYGMGPAVFGRACIDRGLQYVGIDISPEMVRRAQSLNLPGAEYGVGDLDSLEQYRGQMDAVLAIGLLDYLEDPREGIRALAACVKPGGSIILSFRNRHSVPRILRDSSKVFVLPFQRESNRRAYFTPVHERSFDVDLDLRPTLNQLGVEQLETQYFNCSPFFFNFPLPPWLWKRWLDWDRTLASAGTRYFCSGGVVHARTRRKVV